jgi:hypothetical protein
MEQRRTKLPPPTMLPMGEIEFEDGTRMLVPQPKMYRDVWFRLDDAYVLNTTIPELPTHTAVMQHASSNAPQRTDPLWAVVCLRTGLALLAIVAVAFILLGSFLFTVAAIA